MPSVLGALGIASERTNQSLSACVHGWVGGRVPACACGWVASPFIVNLAATVDKSLTGTCLDWRSGLKGGSLQPLILESLATYKTRIHVVWIRLVRFGQVCVGFALGGVGCALGWVGLTWCCSLAVASRGLRKCTQKTNEQQKDTRAHAMVMRAR